MEGLGLALIDANNGRPGRAPCRRLPPIATERERERACSWWTMDEDDVHTRGTIGTCQASVTQHGTGPALLFTPS
jgi:hypothetical protein